MRSKSVPLAKDWNTKHFFKRYRIWKGKSPVLHSKGPVQTEVPVARWCRPSCKLQFPETSRWCHQSIKLCNSHPDVAMVPLWNECAPFRIQLCFSHLKQNTLNISRRITLFAAALGFESIKAVNWLFYPNHRSSMHFTSFIGSRD